MSDNMQTMRETGRMVAMKRAITRLEEHDLDITDLEDLD